MSDIVQTLASHTGLDSSTIENALGTILGMLKAHLPAETFSEIEGKIPDASRLVEAAPDGPESSGGLIAAATKLAGKFLGSKFQDGAELIDYFNKLGISPTKLIAIVTYLYKFLSSHLSPEMMAQVAKSLPSIPGLNLMADGTNAEHPAS